MGSALVPALAAAGFDVAGPLPRGADGAGFGVVLLCVPDQEIAAAAALVEPGRFLGHCSGAIGLDPLGTDKGFSVHPLMTITAAGAPFAGAGAAIAGSSPAALAVAAQLATGLGMEPFEVAPRDRSAYHAAASIASNFLVTLEAAAERLAGSAGVERRALVPLVRATVENWAAVGARRALTGPVARGDEVTVALQRDAVADRAPELLALFDTMVDATRALALSRQEAA